MILTYVGVYLVSYMLASFHYYVASGVLLIAESLVLYAHEYRRTGHIINVSGLYSLSLVGGQGVSCLKLSYIQTDWAPVTWLCFFLAYVCFRAGSRIFEVRERPEAGLSDRMARGYQRLFGGRHFSYKRFLILDCALALVSWAAFILEAAVLGYIPFFVRGVPHAYSEFHISGVHYFTVSCVLCPAVSLIWLMARGGHIRKMGAENLKPSDRSMEHGDRSLPAAELGDSGAAAACAAAAFSGFVIPILCVSRFQLVFALVLAVFVWLVIKESGSPIRRSTLIKLGLGCLAILIPAYIVLTIARSHDAEYLKSIFEMKKDYPIVFSHFYIYIANNFDNFDCMVKNLTGHTFGIRQLFPLLALTGLKFVFPQLVQYEYFLTKKELTTLTLFYDAYYDFGVTGTAIFAMLLGAAGRKLEDSAFRGKDAGAVMLYGQFAIYMALAFFTTWFSNPTTWFYIGVTVIIYVLSWEKDTAAGVEIPEDDKL